MDFQFLEQKVKKTLSSVSNLSSPLKSIDLSSISKENEIRHEEKNELSKLSSKDSLDKIDVNKTNFKDEFVLVSNMLTPLIYRDFEASRQIRHARHENKTYIFLEQCGLTIEDVKEAFGEKFSSFDDNQETVESTAKMISVNRLRHQSITPTTYTTKAYCMSRGDVSPPPVLSENITHLLGCAWCFNLVSRLTALTIPKTSMRGTKNEV